MAVAYITGYEVWEKRATGEEYLVGTFDDVDYASAAAAGLNQNPVIVGALYYSIPAYSNE